MPQRYVSTKLPVDATTEEMAKLSTVEGKRVQDAVNKAGGTQGSSRYVTADTYISGTDSFVFADTTGGAVTLTLPYAYEYIGSVICIKRTAGANTLTVARRGSTDVILNTTGSSSTSITVTTPRYLHASRNGTWEEV